MFTNVNNSHGKIINVNNVNSNKYRLYTYNITIIFKTFYHVVNKKQVKTEINFNLQYVYYMYNYVHIVLYSTHLRII